MIPYACASSGKSSCADSLAAGRGVLLVFPLAGDTLAELLDELLGDPLEEVFLDAALAEDFSDFSEDEVSLALPFLFFGLPFFCTFEVVASGLADGRVGAFGFLVLPPAPVVLGADGTGGLLPALERVTGAMVPFVGV